MLSIVIPALNEEDGIADICRRVLAIEPRLKRVGVDQLELIIVDDGSNDQTVEIVSAFPTVRLIRHSVNRGYGAAIKTGFKQSRGDLLAFLDADGTYPPEYFADLCRIALTDKADVVVGSRRSGGASQMPLVRRVGNLLWSSLVSVIGNHRVADPASGMRLVRRSELERLYPLPDGLNFTPVMSTRSVHEGLKVVEFPITYKERVGRSKLHVVRDGLRFLKTIIWTSLEYNPRRVFGLVAVMAYSIAAIVGVILLARGVFASPIAGQLEDWGLFIVLTLLFGGASIQALGLAAQDALQLHQRPAHLAVSPSRGDNEASSTRGLGSRGLVAVIVSVLVSFVVLFLALLGWDLGRLWFWLVADGLLGLLGIQLIGSSILIRILTGVSRRDQQIAQDLQRDP